MPTGPGNKSSIDVVAALFTSAMIEVKRRTTDETMFWWEAGEVKVGKPGAFSRS